MKRSVSRLVCLRAALWVLLGACGSDELASDAGTRKPSEAGARGDGEDAGAEIQCGDELVCHSPAYCIIGVNSARCACPVGYVDLKGDGSVCQDLDECRIPLICDWNGKCTNTRGSYECECDAPALVAWGNRCICADGYRRSTEGLCLAEDGRPCTDNLDCLNNHCEGGTCCAQRCDRPDECHSAEEATCSDGEHCEYPRARDGTICDDAHACTVDSVCEAGECIGGKPQECDDKNPCTDDSCEEPYGCITKNNANSCDDHDLCTSEDHCEAGRCGGESRNCGEDPTACLQRGCDPHTGECSELPVPDGTPCDDADSCTTSDACVAGSCSAPSDACGPNAIACSPDAPNRCTCAPGFVDNTRGRCVPMNDECAVENACGPEADCDDPSNTDGDVVCTCKKGFAGNGVTCTAVDPCQDNPCGEGRGTCQAAEAPGEHTCSCEKGYIATGDTCACDLSGTFAARSRLDLAWERMTNAIEPGADFTYSYAIERHTYDDRGNLTLELTACGETTVDFCGVGIAPMLAAEAYTQYVPIHVWEMQSQPRVSTIVRVPMALPGASFETALSRNLRGLSLTDPDGPWPPSFRDVAGTPAFDGTAVNGARWLDQDDDGFVGVTSFVVPPGGQKPDGVAPDPPRNYGAMSPVCPRTGGTHTPYAYWPVPPEGLSTVPLRVKRFYTAARVTSAYKGALTSCDEIEGEIVGPNGGPPLLEARVGGCIRENGEGETACPNPAIEFIDSAAQSETVQGSSFLLKRWPSDLPVTCSNARSFSYD
ncbi:MAG: hypothetical protein ABW321_03085 [Polyangiales bacterium]